MASHAANIFDLFTGQEALDKWNKGSKKEINAVTNVYTVAYSV